MNPQRHQQVKEVFLAACDLEPTAVAALLDRQCAGDPELRREVESLLKYHQAETVVAKTTVTTLLSEDRFPPGTVLAGRYRIIAPLGRGGMGEVYRADDLKLNQPLALKFLSRDRGDDPTWLRRYENEVRLARKVTHPNVLRVYDLVEADGEVFISMEYVDGEDLASLLRRVGRLTGDKAVEIAHQLCAGLGAAHDQGVLHRDLKPANIMIDGHGRVRIADFGIAALSEQMIEKSVPAGTPLYMAPELFEGGEPSVGSDLYSLGVVLYDVIAGTLPFNGKPARDADRPATAVRPSETGPGIESALDHVILQCLERDQRRRPQSAYAVAAQIPGGDMLGRALAAGDTPSPSMIAAAGNRAAMPFYLAAGCLAAALAALALVVHWADESFFLPQAGLVKSPDALADRAEAILASLGYELSGAPERQGFAIDYDQLASALARDDQHRTWEVRFADRPPAVYFWYRVGQFPLDLPPLLGDASPVAAQAADSDSVQVELDGRGGLLMFSADLARTFPSAKKARSVDWSQLFALAGVPMADFRPTAPIRHPPMYADDVLAWEGAYPENPELPIRVEAASWSGRPVYFAVVPPWRGASKPAIPVQRPLFGFRRIPIVRLAIYLAGLVAGGFLVWHNLRVGRGDVRGAQKLVAFVLALGLVEWLLGEEHRATFAEELASFYFWMARATMTAVIAWVSYFGLEPYVRKFWPHILIAWMRVLRGQLRDPLVGRDILVGSLAGILLVLVVQLDVLVPSWLGLSAPLPKLPGAAYDLSGVLSMRYKFDILAAVLLASITVTLALLLLMLVLRIVVRPAWLAAVASWLLLTSLLALTSSYDVGFPWLTSSIVAMVVIALLVRAGLVAAITTIFVWTLLLASPITADFQAWYAASGTLALCLTVALLLYGFFTARAGQPMLGNWLPHE